VIDVSIIAYDASEARTVSQRRREAVNVVISNPESKQPIVRYEIHLAGESRTGSHSPADSEYFDDAWQRAVSDGLVDSARRDGYAFQLQRPKTLYESST
jgi:hypothetical protein